MAPQRLRPAAEGQPVSRFLAIGGASGSGKSSVAPAGLVAALKRDEIAGSSRWPIAIFRPGPEPLENLLWHFPESPILVKVLQQLPS
jgi:hypothetical protein